MLPFEKVIDAISSTTVTMGTSMADVNGDGHIDIIIGAQEMCYFPTQVMQNQGNGTFTELEGSIPASISSGNTTADLDGDGSIDLVIGYDNEDYPIEILLNNGNGIFEKAAEVVIWFGAQFVPQSPIWMEMADWIS